jgi:hypothetical protein
MRKTALFLTMAGFLLAAGNASSADFGLYGTVGTVGLGGGVAVDLNKNIGFRLGYTTYSYDVDEVEDSDLTFNGEADLGGLQAMVDWYPFGGGFHISAGLMDSVDLNATAVPVGDSYVIDGEEYDADDIGDARGSVDCGSTAPYLGLGFGRALSADGHFSFVFDMGLIFTGEPDVSLNVTCAAANADFCNDLAADVAAEEAAMQEDANDLKYWPLLSFGLSYKF